MPKLLDGLACLAIGAIFLCGIILLGTIFGDAWASCEIDQTAADLTSALTDSNFVLEGEKQAGVELKGSFAATPQGYANLIQTQKQKGGLSDDEAQGLLTRNDHRTPATRLVPVPPTQERPFWDLTSPDLAQARNMKSEGKDPLTMHLPGFVQHLLAQR